MIYRTRGEHANQYTTEAVSPQKRYIEITLIYDSINQLVGCRHWTATLDKIFDRRATEIFEYTKKNQYKYRK